MSTFLAGPDGDLAKTVGAALERVGLAERARARTADLSGGQQQRDAGARFWCNVPT